jgi:hypothetical protein
MNMLSRCLILILLLTPTASLMAQERYGEATVHEGRMTVLRDGQRMNVTQSDGRADIVEKDVIRVGSNSRVTLETREKATVTLGSNAVMQIEPWQSRRQSGFFRALFGKVRAQIVGLTGGERFNVRTATATIGVKGSGWDGGITSTGDQVTNCTDDECFVQGNVGPEQNFPPGFSSVTLGGGPATPPAPTPPEVLNAFSDTGDGLDSPPPTSDSGRNLPGEEGLVRAGVVTQTQVNQSKRGQADLDEEVEGEEGGAPGSGPIELDLLFSLDDAVQESKKFSIQLDVNFEN